jgi:hypothetical protein
MKTYKIKAIPENIKTWQSAALEIYDHIGNYIGSIDNEGNIQMNKPELIRINVMEDFINIFGHFETYFESLISLQNELELLSIPTLNLQMK